jgi:uncharacterized protein (DUF2461 family)
VCAFTVQVGLEQQMACGSLNAQQLSELRSQIRQLIKFVALNYLAVVKAIKKRNRHCKVGQDVSVAAAGWIALYSWTVVL